MKTKAQLRNEVKQGLSLISQSDYDLYSQVIKDKLLQSSSWQKANTIGITISMESEVNTRPIIEAGWQQEKQIVVPKCYPKQKQLQFYRICSFNEVESSFYGLQEPVTAITPLVNKNEIDLLIVPGLLFDKKGYRIGYGGGYYDRFLSNFKNDTLALAFTVQIISEIPKEEHDIPVKKIISNSDLEE